MLESAAQVCSFYSGMVVKAEGFLGLGGMDGGEVPGRRRDPERSSTILGSERVLTPTRCQFDTQGVVNGKVVFEATILGLRIRWRDGAFRGASLRIHGVPGRQDLSREG